MNTSFQPARSKPPSGASGPLDSRRSFRNAAQSKAATPFRGLHDIVERVGGGHVTAVVDGEKGAREIVE
ncbi:MAG: hypothetical protein WDO68_17320 [Gammaproteobacteria bacterium]